MTAGKSGEALGRYMDEETGIHSSLTYLLSCKGTEDKINT